LDKIVEPPISLNNKKELAMLNLFTHGILHI